MTKEKSISEEKARSIVLMLLLRKRRAYRLWKTSKEEGLFRQEQGFFGHYIEAHNAAELARRILYGHEL